MLDFTASLPTPTPKPARYLKQALAAFADHALAGRVSVRVPKVQDLNRPGPGMHFHSQPEMFLQVGGITDFAFPSQRLRLFPGEILLMPRGMPHRETVGRWRSEFVNLVVILHRPGLSCHIADQGQGRRPKILHAQTRKPEQMPAMSELMDGIVQAHERNGHNASASGLLLAALGLLAETFATEDNIAPEEAYKVHQCRQFVLATLSDPTLSVKRLAEWVQCSADYLSHLFHLETGETLSRYITRVRLEHARQLLANTSMNVSETAWASGYADPGYFIRVFRREYGKTPKQYRNVRKARRAAAT